MWLKRRPGGHLQRVGVGSLASWAQRGSKDLDLVQILLARPGLSTTADRMIRLAERCP